MFNAEAIDDLDPARYLHSTLDANTLLKELGFTLEGMTQNSRMWMKKDDWGNQDSTIWHLVITNPLEPHEDIVYKKLSIVKGTPNKTLVTKQVPLSGLRRIMMNWNESSDDLDPTSYLHSTLNPDIVLKELGFRFEGTNEAGSGHWLKSAGRGIWHSVIVDKDNPNVNYRQVRVKGRGVLNKEFQVMRHLQVPVSEVRRVMLKWIDPGAVSEAADVLHLLLDADVDAFDPRADLERLMPNRCPECGSSNVSEADEEGLIDCFDCGIWFNPLHPANSPSVPGNYPLGESLEDEISDLRAYAMAHGLPPRITITYSRTTPESAEQGDFSESGWLDEEGVSMAIDEWDRENGITVTDKAATYLYEHGCFETSSSHFHPGIWYSDEWSTIDYSTGEQEERNYHLVGFTDEQEREVWDKFHQRRRH